MRLPDMIWKGKGSEAKLFDASKTISKRNTIKEKIRSDKNAGDLSAFSSTWLADWEHFCSFGDISGCYISSSFYMAKFRFLYVWPNFFLFFFSTRLIHEFLILDKFSMENRNFRLIFELTYNQKYTVSFQKSRTFSWYFTWLLSSRAVCEHINRY